MTLERIFACFPLLLVPACVPSDDGKPDDSRSGFHDVTVKWHIKNLDGTVVSACPAGFTTLFTHLYVVDYVEPPDALVMTPCTPEGSLTQPVATAGALIDEATRGEIVPAYYNYTPQKDIWIDVTEATQSAHAALSYTYYVKELTSDTTIDFDLYPDGGVGVAAWTLTSSLTTAPLTSCATAGVDEIEAAVRLFDDDTAPLVVAGTWPCDQIDPYFYYDPDGNSTLLTDDDNRLGSGHTSAFAPADYFVEMRAKRAGAIVGTSEGNFTADTANSAHKINATEIPISDR